MSKKSPRIAALIAHLQGGYWPAGYAGFFECFNVGLYYEAHDVLEELWLAGGKSAPNYAFHKGLIQLAGAFVHLQKNRLRPAVALFNLADSNLQKYRHPHDGLDLQKTLALIQEWRASVVTSDYSVNPLPIRPAPKLILDSR